MSASILVIEDDPALQHIFTHILSRLGYEVVTIGDGKSALDYLKTHVPSLIFLDVRLPHTNGERILDYLQSEKRFHYTRTIVMSATYQHSQLPHANDFILKPIMPQQIQRIVQETMTHIS